MPARATQAHAGRRSQRRRRRRSSRPQTLGLQSPARRAPSRGAPPAATVCRACRYVTALRPCSSAVGLLNRMSSKASVSREKASSTASWLAQHWPGAGSAWPGGQMASMLATAATLASKLGLSYTVRYSLHVQARCGRGRYGRMRARHMWVQQAGQQWAVCQQESGAGRLAMPAMQQPQRRRLSTPSPLT